MSSVFKIRKDRKPTKRSTFRVKNYKTDPRYSIKHPDFDRMWEKNQRLCWWWAKRCARYFGGHGDDYIGTLTIRFNYALYYHKPELGAFTTYFSRRMYGLVLHDFVRHESENRSVYYMAIRSSEEEVQQLQENYAYHESNRRFYRAPDADNDWAQEIIANFDDPIDCWDFITKEIDHRAKEILRARCEEGATFEDLGIRYKVSKERVRQIEAASIKSIRIRLRKLETWTHLFKDNDPSPD